MMVFPRVQAVAGPYIGADVIFDFNRYGSWFSTKTLEDGWTLGTPERLSGVGDARTSWGPRRAEFAITITGSRPQALAAQSILGRWLLGAEGWVLFQLDALSPPVWLRMLGADPGDLDFRTVGAVDGFDRWGLSVSFDAEPFLYGERVTLFEGVVPNDPTTGGGMVAPLGYVPGDAPMPLRVKVAATGASLPWLYSYRLVSLAHAAGSSALVVVPVGAGDTATGVSADVTTVSSPLAIGGTARLIGFDAADGSVERTAKFTIEYPEVLAHGAYRVLVKVVGTSSALTSSMSVTTTHEGVSGHTAVTVVDWGSPTEEWVDLGEIVHPTVGYGGEPGPIGTGLTSLTFKAGRVSSLGGSLRISAIVLVPVLRSGFPEARSLSSARAASDYSYASPDVTYDADYETAWMTTPSGARVGTRRAHRGGWPTATPGYSTTVFIARQVVDGPTATSVPFTDTPTDTALVTVTGQPQWLYLPNSQEG